MQSKKVVMLIWVINYQYREKIRKWRYDSDLLTKYLKDNYTLIAYSWWNKESNLLNKHSFRNFYQANWNNL